MQLAVWAPLVMLTDAAMLGRDLWKLVGSGMALVDSIIPSAQDYIDWLAWLRSTCILSSHPACDCCNRMAHNGSQWLMTAECLQQVWGIWQDARVDYLAETQLSCNCTSLGAEPVTSDAAGYVRYMYVYVPWCK